MNTVTFALVVFAFSFLGIAFFSWIIEAFAFKSKAPNERAAWTVGTVIAIGIVLTLLTEGLSAEAAPVLIARLFAGVLVFVWFRHRYAKRWSDGPEDVFE